MVLPARIRWDGRWVTATVRNLSPHGLMLCATPTPPVGCYIEVQILSEFITARSVWCDQHRCGLRSRERLDVNRVLSRSDGMVANAGVLALDRATDQRREFKINRGDREEQSRQISSAIQYLTALAVAVSAAGSLGWEVYQTLSAPITAVGAQLSKPL